MSKNAVSLMSEAVKTTLGLGKAPSEATPRRKRKKHNLANFPPKGSPEVASFFGELYEGALAERDRLGMPQRWLANYVITRAKRQINSKLRDMLMGGHSASLSLGLVGANIERTVANITARNPVASVQSTTGDESISAAISAKCDFWNNAEEQHDTLETSVKIQETYGTVVEKVVLDMETQEMRCVPLDITAFIPAPGKFHNVQRMPYCCHHYVEDMDALEKRFGIKSGVLQESSGIESLFLTEREDAVMDSNISSGSTSGFPSGVGHSSGYYRATENDPGTPYNNKTVAVEFWCKDYATRKINGEDRLVHPGGIRVLVIARDTREGYKVLYDGPNPNVNWALTPEQVEKSYLFKRYPFNVTRSYKDTEMFWGFAQAETTGDIAQAIDELWRIIVRYLKMCLQPPVIIPKDTGLDSSHFAYIPRLILQPNSYQTSQGIRILEMPAPPAWLFQALDVLVRFFDRTSQIEDVDRGDAPSGIVAASAIQMLQERAAVLIRAKIRAVDSLVRNRGRCYISFLQNFHVEEEVVNVSGTAVPFRGIDFLGGEFAYIVESGSTVIKTEAEDRQMATDLFGMGAIDQRALLETIKFTGWRDIIERMNQAGPLEQAMQIMIDAGMPEEFVQQLYEFLQQSQGGPGDDPVARASGAMKQGGNSMAQNTQPMAAGRGGGGGGADMKGKAPQRQRGGAPAKPGVPMTAQKG
jgi:hypothetical protein